MGDMYNVEPGSFPAITKEMNDRAKSAMQRTWQTIAPDLFECTGDKFMWRSHVVEVVCDANYMESYGGDNEAAKYCIWMSRFYKNQFNKLCKETFAAREG